MNTRIVALTCALTAGACGGADTRPPETPPGSTSSAPGTSITTSASPADPSAGTTRNTAHGPSTPASSKEGARPVDPGASTSSTASSDPNARTTAPGTGATVANNPGGADQTKNADNTKINERDRQGALTPMDQGNSGSEINITAAVRKALMADKALSFTAKNVKVITIGNKVTLRGPVKSDQERASIEAIAKQTAGVSEVDNQLEVKK